MHKKDILIVFFSLVIILIIVISALFQIRKAMCLKEKETFIKTTLPEVYGPETTIEKREADNKKISDIYYSCLYPWQ